MVHCCVVGGGSTENQAVPEESFELPEAIVITLESENAALQLAAVGIDSLGQQLIQVHSYNNNAPGVGHSENGYGRQVDEWHIDDGLGGALGALLSLSLSLADGE